MKSYTSLLACFAIVAVSVAYVKAERPSAIEVLNAIAAIEAAETGCQIGAGDFVFVVDESGSVGAPAFATALKFVANLTLALNIGQGDDQSRVGLVKFGNTASVAFYLNSYMTNSAVYNAIVATTYASGGTNIASGMDAAINQVFTTAGGVRPSAPRIMIVLTDGGDNSNVSASHQNAVNKNITTYAIAIGTGVSYNQLLRVTGDMSKVFNVSTFDGLTQFLPTFCQDLSTNKPRECKCTSYNVYLDIVIAIDSSDGVGIGFAYMKELLADIVRHMTVNQTTGVRASRIAVINFAQTAQVVADLTTFQSAAEASTAIENINPLGGKTVNFESVILNASQIFASDGNRPNIKDVLLLFSSASAKCPENSACRPAADLMLSDVVIATFAMGFEDPPPTLQLGSPCYMQNNTGNLAQKILYALCQVNCYCAPYYTQFISTTDKCHKYAECVLAGPHGLETWEGARRTCQATTPGLKGYMVDSLSKEKEQFLFSIAKANQTAPYWIGLNDQASPGTYMWDRGVDSPVPLRPSDYTNWYTSPNDAGQQYCVMGDVTNFGYTSHWFNYLCDDIFGDGGIKYVLCQTIAYDTDNVPGTL
uniref:Uncharacterized protein n=1 Tax=Plectus sambesii TaxID=2011161 RepID=A0A914XBE9_9BILA